LRRNGFDPVREEYTMQNTNATGRVISGLAAAGLAAYAVKGTSNPTGRVVSAIASALLGAHAATGFSPDDMLKSKG
jgi:hypothetical protein